MFLFAVSIEILVGFATVFEGIYASFYGTPRKLKPTSQSVRDQYFLHILSGGPDKDFLFRGLVKCGHCGWAITSEYHVSKNGHRNNYLRCNNHGKSKIGCPQCTMNEKDLLKQLDEQILSKIQIDDGFVETVKEGIKERISEENKVNRAKKQSIQAQIQSLRGKESKLLDMFLEGKCTQAMYEAKTAEFKEQIKELEDKLELSPEAGKEAVSAMNAILQVVSAAREIMNSSVNSKKRGFLRLILPNCVLTDKSACFYLKKP